MFARFLAPAAGLLVLVSVHPVARSQVTGGHANSQFVRSWDQNGDAKVSRAEYDDARVKRYATTDADKSGALSQDEYINEYAVRLDEQIADEKKASIQQTDTRFRALDKDHDNFIARAEYDPSGTKAFEHLDPDRDGNILERESKAQGAARPVGQGVIRMPTTHALRRQDQLKQGGVRFKSIDADKNGSISRDEYVAMSARMFERTDTNKDGVVSQDDPAPPQRDREQERSAGRAQ